MVLTKIRRCQQLGVDNYLFSKHVKINLQLTFGLLSLLSPLRLTDPVSESQQSWSFPQKEAETPGAIPFFGSFIACYFKFPLCSPGI